MELFVNNILSKADFSVVTKKNIRQQYSSHVGRDLELEEKSQINELVLSYVVKCAEEEKKSPSSSLDGDRPSPGNKENVQQDKRRGKPQSGSVSTNRTPRKSSRKKLLRTSSTAPSPSKSLRAKGSSPRKSLRKSPGRKRRNMSPRLKFDEVMTAVLDDTSDSSSQSESEASDSESDTGSHAERLSVMKDALARLNSERDKKIQMSLEKKRKSGVTLLKDKGEKKTVVKKLQIDKLQKDDETSDSVILLSEEDPVKIEKLKKTNERLDKLRTKKQLKVVERDSDVDSLAVTPQKGSQSDSGPITLNRTPENYQKRGSKLSKHLSQYKGTYSGKDSKDQKKRNSKLSKKRKAVSDSDSDSESSGTEIQRRKRRKLEENRPKVDIKRKLKKPNKKQTGSTFNSVSDDESSLGGTPQSKKMGNRIDKKKVYEINTNSDSDMPLSNSNKANKKDVILVIDSDTSAFDSPLVKKRKTLKVNKLLSSDSGSDSSTGDTPLIKKKEKLKNHKSEATDEKVVCAENTPLKKSKMDRRTNSKGNTSGNVSESLDSDSDSSTGDTPLIKKKQKLNKKIVCSSTENTPLKKSKMSKRQTDSKGNVHGHTSELSDVDSDSSTGDTPLIKKCNPSKLGKKFEKDQLKTETENSTGNTRVSGPVTIVTDSDTECEKSTKGTRLVKRTKKQSRKVSDSESESEMSIENTSPVSKKSNKRGKLSNCDDSDSENDSLAKNSSLLKNQISKKRKTSVTSTDNDTPIKKVNSRLNTSLSKSLSNSDSEASKLVIDEASGDSDSRCVSDSERSLSVKNKASDDSDSDSRSEASFVSKSRASGDGDSDSRSEASFVSKSRASDESDSNSGSSVSSVNKEASDSSDSVSESESETEKTVKNKVKTGRGKKKETQKTKSPVIANRNDDAGNASEDSDDIPLAKLSATGGESSEDSDDIPLAQVSAGKNTSKRSRSSSSESDLDDLPLSKVKKIGKKPAKTSNKKKSPAGGASENSAHLKRLRLICRACGMFIRNDRELKGCSTERQKVARLKELLQKAGMIGQPSMKKAEEVRLRKEAAELSSENILSSEPSHGKRRVNSRYSRRKATPVKSPRKVSPKKTAFTRLKGIVDSEGSSAED